MDWGLPGAGILLLNVIGFLLIGYDKYKARRQQWRIPERRFFWISILGGGIGVYLGMQAFRHKTQHQKFIIGIPLIILVELLIVGYLLWRFP